MTQHIKKLLEPDILLLGGIVYITVITFFLLMPAGNLPKVGFQVNDKAVHFVLHFLLVFIWSGYFFVAKKGILSLKSLMLIFFAALFYGIIIEILQQLYIVSRKADIMDLLANIAGALTAILVFWKLKAKMRSKI